MAAGKRKWQSAATSATAWRRALDLIYHPKFEAAVWKKFGLTRKARSREAGPHTSHTSYDCGFRGAGRALWPLLKGYLQLGSSILEL